jgi:hypothetical protein
MSYAIQAGGKLTIEGTSGPAINPNSAVTSGLFGLQLSAASAASLSYLGNPYSTRNIQAQGDIFINAS